MQLKTPVTLPLHQSQITQMNRQIVPERNQVKVQTTRQQAQIQPLPHRHSSHSQNCSPSCSPSPYHSHSPRQHRRRAPCWCNQDNMTVIPAPSSTDSMETFPEEDCLLIEWASNGQVSFYTYLMLRTKNGMKSMTVKIDCGAQVNSNHWAGIGKYSSTKFMNPGTPNKAPSSPLTTSGFPMMANPSPS